MYHHIAEHLDEQFSFRAGHSCEAQLISVVEDIQLAMDNISQVDMIFIDFRKASDTVPHCRLLNKLSHYGIQGTIYDWIKIWLTQRTQRVVVNGHDSNFVQVQSGVPQGTVLGPLMFCSTLMTSSVASHPIILYRTINSQQDQLLLQHDLNLTIKWTETWLIELNTSKCVVLTCSRLTSSFTFNYIIRNHFLQRVTQHPYLRTLFDSKISFSPHINQVISKATRMLNFVNHNVYRCSAETKSLAYTSIVRPLLEYGSAVWDPYLQKNIQSIEMVK